jgi:hypothetical protein
MTTLELKLRKLKHYIYSNSSLQTKVADVQARRETTATINVTTYYNYVNALFYPVYQVTFADDSFSHPGEAVGIQLNAGTTARIIVPAIDPIPRTGT